MRIGTVLLAWSLVASPLGNPPALAQALPGSPIQDLLAQARSALDDLRYSDADSIAKGILALSQIGRGDRIQALQIQAGARFPDQASFQLPEAAAETLRELIRLAPGAGLPRAVSWRGLDSLYREARSTTFGLSASPVESVVLIGADGEARIPVVASRPARMQLILIRKEDGSRRVLDSIPYGEGAALRLSAMAAGNPILVSGEHELEVRGTDIASGEVRSVRFRAVFDVPRLDLVPVPTTLDSSQLLPEISKANRTGGLIGGIAVAIGTVVVSSVVRDRAIRDGTNTGSARIGLGLALGGATVAGVWVLDKGAPIPANIARNQELRVAFSREVADAHAENEQRIANYRVIVTISLEPLP